MSLRTPGGVDARATRCPHWWLAAILVAGTGGVQTVPTLDMLPVSQAKPASRPPHQKSYRVHSMSNRVSISELRQRASGVLRRVTGGEVVEVTDHGHPTARIVPWRPGVLDQLVLEGRATEASCDLLDLIETLGLPVAGEPGGMAPSLALAELRSDER